MSFDHQLAPGAEWTARHVFEAPIGRLIDGSKKKFLYRFQPNAGIRIRGNMGDQLLIEAKDSPYHHNDANVSIEPSWVSAQWLMDNFYFYRQTKSVHYSLSRWGTPYSTLGLISRILDSEDALLELTCAYRKENRGLSLTPHWNRWDNPPVPMDRLFDILDLLTQRGLLSLDFELSYAGEISALGLPWIGLVCVTNGEDNSALMARTRRAPLTVLYPQFNVFILDDEEMFFELKLTMEGTKSTPKFFHRESVVIAG